MAKRRSAVINWYRTPLQVALLAVMALLLLHPLFDPAALSNVEAYCPYGGMQALASLVVNNSLACNMSGAQIVMGVLLLAGVVAASKLFCSTLCPIGTFTEWLGRIGRSRKWQRSLTGWGDRTLRLLKYGMLFLTFYFTVESSELFCRTFDPYYAVMTGFSQDVVLWYALPALLVTILGSLFLKQFWCKYLCPLGAASNLMTNLGLVLTLGAFFLSLALFGWSLPWIWILAIVSFIGFLVEAIRMKGWVVPGLKITRNPDICSGCKKCDKACPMAIPISEVLTVQHIDCHLCTDCVGVCPDKGSLTINHRNLRWLPPSITLALVVVGIMYGSRVEVPTIDQKWGSDAQLQHAAVYVKSGLLSIKCFGSSSSFAEHMKELPGVLGVRTYASTHTVHVLYDPTQLTPARIREFMFTPARRLLRAPEADAATARVELGIDKLFDGVDQDNLGSLLAATDGVYAYASEFGEPVQVTIWFDLQKIDGPRLRALIENPHSGKVRKNKQDVSMDFAFPVRTLRTLEGMKGRDVQRLFFEPFDMIVNEYSRIDSSMCQTIEFPFPAALDPARVEDLPLLASHLSDDPGILSMETRFTTSPVLRITYLTTKTAPERIRKALGTPRLNILYESGRREQIENPFQTSFAK